MLKSFLNSNCFIHYFDYPQEVLGLWTLTVRYYDFYSFIAYCAAPNAAVLSLEDNSIGIS